MDTVGGKLSVIYHRKETTFAQKRTGIMRKKYKVQVVCGFL
jgi:hypothetical protein